MGMKNESKVGMNILCSHSEQNSQTRRDHQRKGRKNKKKIFLPCFCIELYSKTNMQTKTQNETCTTLNTLHIHHPQNKKKPRNVTEVSSVGTFPRE